MHALENRSHSAEERGPGPRAGQIAASVAIMLLAALALAVAGCGTPKLGTEGNPIVMSFVPASNAPVVVASGQAIARAITEMSGLVVTSTVGADMAAVREAVCANKAQIAWLNTFHYLLAHDRCGVEVSMVTERMGATAYQAQIIVRADSGMATLQDLKGRVVCWVDPNSRSGYILPRMLLKANGIDPDKDLAGTVESGSYNNVIAQVYNGTCAAGATYVDARDAMEKELPDLKSKVAILATTAVVPNDSLAFARDFPAEMREEIVAALLSYATTDAGRQALNSLYSISGLQPIDDSYYDPFRAELSRAGMNIGSLVE